MATIRWQCSAGNDDYSGLARTRLANRFNDSGKRGTDLLAQVIADIDSNPSRWNQSVWAEATEWCGTIGCIAGNAVMACGFSPIGPNLEKDYGDPTGITAPLLHDAGWSYSGATGEVFDREGNCHHVWSLARSLMGLSDAQASWLFEADRGIDDIRVLADYLTWNEDNWRGAITYVRKGDLITLAVDLGAASESAAIDEVNMAIEKMGLWLPWGPDIDRVPEGMRHAILASLRRHMRAWP